MPVRPKGRVDQYSGKRVSNTLFVEGTLQKIDKKIRKVVKDGVAKQTDVILSKVSKAVLATTDNFFKDLASYLGHEEDLYSQLGSQAPGLRPWAPLTKDYVREKGSISFFLYLLSKNPTRRRMDARIKLSKNKQSQTLINRFRGFYGNHTFGGVNIEVIDEETKEVVWKDRVTREVQKVVTRQRLGKTETFTRKYATSDFVDAVGLGFKIKMTLWAKFNKTQLKNIEKALVGQGINENEYYKLTNPRGKTRPLLRPFMAYYSETLIPKIVKEALASYKTRAGTHINVTGNATNG